MVGFTESLGMARLDFNLNPQRNVMLSSFAVVLKPFEAFRASSTLKTKAKQTQNNLLKRFEIDLIADCAHNGPRTQHLGPANQF